MPRHQIVGLARVAEEEAARREDTREDVADVYVVLRPPQLAPARRGRLGARAQWQRRRDEEDVS